MSVITRKYFTQTNSREYRVSGTEFLTYLHPKKSHLFYITDLEVTSRSMLLDWTSMKATEKD